MITFLVGAFSLSSRYVPFREYTDFLEEIQKNCSLQAAEYDDVASDCWHFVLWLAGVVSNPGLCNCEWEISTVYCCETNKLALRSIFEIWTPHMSLAN